LTPRDKETDVAPAAHHHRLEETVAEAFASLLEIPEVGWDDDFFALGGDSILAMKLNLIVSELVGTDIPLETLFAAPTVRGFSSAIQGLAD
jgi:acyl carrier protein